MNSKAKIAIICAVLISAAGGLWIATTSRRPETTLTYSQFLEKVQTGQIAGVTIADSNSGATQAICRMKDGHAARAVLPPGYREAVIAMEDNRINVQFQYSPSGPSLTVILMNAAPFLLLLGVWIFLVIRRPPGSRWNATAWKR
jgi:cell division protease FtsH